MLSFNLSKQQTIATILSLPANSIPFLCFFFDALSDSNFKKKHASLWEIATDGSFVKTSMNSASPIDKDSIKMQFF